METTTPRRSLASSAAASFCSLLLVLLGLPETMSAASTAAISISPQLPADIPGGAPNATLSQAAAFAWQEFIALNWPAAPQGGQIGQREMADATKFFGDPSYNSAAKPLVWHTYRAKVEIFPGFGVPAGSQAVAPGSPRLQNLSPAGSAPYYGYDALPAYVYGSGAIAPFSGTPSAITPWINLDEISQIGLDQIYAGVAQGVTTSPGNQILFLAKGSRAEFDYLAPLGWWAGEQAGNIPFKATKAYLEKNQASPPPGSTTYVSFPNGTIELKAAWRKLGPNEDASRFYTTTARYYVTQNNAPAYVDDTFALVGLHIIHKTPTAPYFIFATFEQADNITAANGQPVENSDGAYVASPVEPLLPPAFTPDVVSHNARPGGFQTFTPTQSNVANPGSQLFFQNTPDTGLTEGTILVNRRKHAIPGDIVAVNAAAHQAIAAYIAANFPAGTKSPWAHYKLVNVQAVPIGGKVPGVDYTASDAATFYQANSVVETDYNLQVFSGRFYPGNYFGLSNTITDFNADGTPFTNVTYPASSGQTSFNMGGCMGCHGNAQQNGSDFSFILLGGPVSAPDTVTAQGLSGGVSGLTAPSPSHPAVRDVKRVQRYPLR